MTPPVDAFSPLPSVPASTAKDLETTEGRDVGGVGLAVSAHALLKCPGCPRPVNRISIRRGTKFDIHRGKSKRGLGFTCPSCDVKICVDCAAALEPFGGSGLASGSAACGVAAPPRPQGQPAPTLGPLEDEHLRAHRFAIDGGTFAVLQQPAL